MRIKRILVMVLATAGLLVACGGNKGGGGTTSNKAGAEKKLFDRLGGMDAISAVVEKLVSLIENDQRISSFFKNADKKHLKVMLAQQICAATGGPCTYTGKDMKTAHIGMGVKEADFAALVDDLVKALDEFKVPKKEKDELLAILGGLKGQIVQ